MGESVKLKPCKIAVWLILLSAPQLWAACTTTISNGTNLTTTVTNVAAGGTVCLNAGSYTYSGSVSKASMTFVQPTDGVAQSAVSVSVTVTGGSNLTFQNVRVTATISGNPTHIYIKNSTVTSSICVNGTSLNNSDIQIDGNDFNSVGQGCTEGRMGVTGGGSANSGVVIKNNIFGPGGASDGVQLTNGARGVTIGPGNEFKGIKEALCGAVHCDPIQFYGSGIGNVITGNYFHGNSTGFLGSSFPGDQITFSNNVWSTDGEYPDQIVLENSVGTTIQHETFTGGAGIRLCVCNGQGPSSGIIIKNSAVNYVNFTETQSSAGATISFNLSTSAGARGASGVNGSPTFTGGATPTTYAGFQLTPASAGHNAASDGTDMGVQFSAPTGGPSITGLNVSSGTVGTPVTITGSGFGGSQSTSTVAFNGTPATATGWSDISISTSVPVGATSGNVIVTVGGTPSNAVTFTVTTPVPNISSINVGQGDVGDSVIISGTNFGGTKGTSTVAFNGTTAATTAWGDTSVTATVPPGATTGNIVVTVNSPSNGVPFQITTHHTGGTIAVQSAGTDAGLTTNTTLAYALNNAAGNNSLVCIRGGNTGETFAVTDTNGNTYNQVLLQNEATGGETLGIYRAANILAGANVVTVNQNQVQILRIAIAEYHGIVSTDGQASAIGASTTLNSGNIATTANGDIILGCGLTANNASFTAGAGYTLEESVPVSPNSKLVLEDQIQASSGTIAATSTIGVSDNWGMAVLALATQATGFPVASLAPSSISFSGINVNTTSPSQTVILTNTGTAAMGITSISLTGTNNGDFFQSNNCPVGSTLGNGSACTITVTFTPLAVGSRTASVSVVDSASGSPHTSALSGTGVQASISGQLTPGARLSGRAVLK